MRRARRSMVSGVVGKLARRGAQSALCLLVLLPVACVKDQILPVDSVCGNGKKEGPEECDFLPDAGGSIGCVNCKIAPGFTCGDTSCEATCGDGSTAAPLEDCDPPDGITCDSSCRSGAKAEACDMTGYWIIRKTTFSIDNLVNGVQTTSDWTAFKLLQTGTAFEVQKAVACGIYSTGATAVLISDVATRNLLWKNPQGADSPPPRPPRRGTFLVAGGSCDFSMDRFYKVRGCDEAQFLPQDFLSKPALSTLVPLPYELDPLSPTGANLAGQVDVEGDGYPGIAYILSGNITGVRHVIQRDWEDFYSASTHVVAQKAIEFVARADFDNEENILNITNCPDIGCGILNVGSRPSATLAHRVTFRYLGKDLADTRVSRIVTRELHEDLDADEATCALVRAALPHDPSSE